MKKNYKVTAPPQKYLELPKIYATYGSRPVVAYGCKVTKSNTPIGGHVIAVQDKADDPTDGIKEYMKQLKARFADKEPIYYICVKEDAIVYDIGEGNVRTLPDIAEKAPSKAQKAIDGMSDELLAAAVASVFKEETI